MLRCDPNARTHTAGLRLKMKKFSNFSSIFGTVLACLCFFTISCDKAAEDDARALDEILNTNLIEVVETKYLYSTNSVIGEEAAALVKSLHKTNRLATSHRKKTEHIATMWFKSGTNYVGGVDVYENGLICNGNYCFRIKN